MSLGISISGLVCMSELQGLGDTTSRNVDISRLIESLSSMGEDEKTKYVLKFAMAMKNVFLQVTVFMAIGTLASFLLRSHVLENTIRSDHRVRPSTASTATTTGKRSKRAESIGGSSTEMPVLPTARPVLRSK